MTPTGAAIVATLCDTFGPQPAMNASAIGYGAGAADLEGQPNVMRLTVGEVAQHSEVGTQETIRVLEANIDDMNPQIYGYFLEKALASGALDVFYHPRADEEKPSWDFDHGCYANRMKRKNFRRCCLRRLQRWAFAAPGRSGASCRENGSR